MKQYIRELISDHIDVDESIDDAEELYERLNFDFSMDKIIENNLEHPDFIDLEKWAVNNKRWIEGAVKDKVCMPDTPLSGKIRSGQWLSIKTVVEWEVRDLYKELDGVAFNAEVA